MIFVVFFLYLANFLSFFVCVFIFIIYCYFALLCVFFSYMSSLGKKLFSSRPNKLLFLFLFFLFQKCSVLTCCFFFFFSCSFLGFLVNKTRLLSPVRNCFEKLRSNHYLIKKIFLLFLLIIFFYLINIIKALRFFENRFFI